MGLTPKSQIEKAKRQKREAKAARKRGMNTRAKHVRFLIVCEGKATEPDYFKALLNSRQSDVYQIDADIHGAGRSTCALVRQAQELRQKLEVSKQLAYDRVWVVFDKDDFRDFHEAILLCRSLGFGAAWTNEAFELWFCLHFQYLDTAVSRADYIEILTRELRYHTGDMSYK